MGSSNQANHSTPNLNQPLLNCIGPTTPNCKDGTNLSMGYPQNIINEMNCLKNEYKQLKSAYKDLIEEKINNFEKMTQIKEENRKL